MQFQIIYRSSIYTDGYDNFAEALEDMNSDIAYAKEHNKPQFDAKYFSIEVLIERDFKRRDGIKDTRVTVEELAKDYMDKEYNDAISKIEEMKRVLS